MNLLSNILQILFFVVASPLISGFVKSAKCKMQNRKGPSIFQPYRNLNKLLRKELIVAENASYVFYMAPYLIFSATVLASVLIPLLGVFSPHNSFADVIVLVGLFALARFFIALAAMDVGTSFGGMGSSREMLIAVLAEPALLMAFFTLAVIARSTNLSVIAGNLAQNHFFLQPSLIFAAMGFVLVALAETGRIPIDNPATHLELTMVHEAMILEYSGRHLALLEWASQIKFMIYCVLFVNLFFPWDFTNIFSLYSVLFGFFIALCKVIALCFILVIAEINLAKLRLFRAPYLLNLAFLFCLLGVLNHVILEV